MKFVFQKPDMDTALTALILGCRETDAVVWVEDQAPHEYLEDPAGYCIECGGSGQVEIGNFDHHNTSMNLPPACVQAFQYRGCHNSSLDRLVNYVAGVDSGKRCQSSHNHFGLSSLYSGMRLVHQNLFDQFWAGLKMLNSFLYREIPPAGPLPLLPEWQSYREAKERQQEKLEKEIQRTEIFETRSGVKGGFLESPYPGIHGLLRRLGCEISIARGLRKGNQSKPFYTISGFQKDLFPIIKKLGKYESGWGGPAHGQIIGSPPRGTSLSKQALIDVVKGL